MSFINFCIFFKSEVLRCPAELQNDWESEQGLFAPPLSISPLLPLVLDLHCIYFWPFGLRSKILFTQNEHLFLTSNYD